MTKPLLIGLTGKRYVGKSTITTALKAYFDFKSVHSFSLGLSMAADFFRNMDIPSEDVHRMVYGDLKDVPDPRLPNGVAPRYFLEPFGNFMGTHPKLGPDWTLRPALRSVQRAWPTSDLVAESIVYEAKAFKEEGGIIVRVLRDVDNPVGEYTDAAQAEIAADYEFDNSGSLDDLPLNLNILLNIIREERA